MAYKHVIRANTKNLFDISNANVTQHNGYWTSNADFTQHFYTQIVEPGKTYTVSYECYCPTSGIDSLSLSVQTGSGFYDGTRLYTGLVTASRDKWVKQYGVFTIPNGITQVTLSSFLFSMFRNLQIEEGSTPTPYTPYNYLQSNKRMIKVNDVCQLLDKSKYNLPHTESGLTFTAGTDGSIIVSGTCNSTVWANISSFELNPEHTFILIGCPGTNVNDVALYTLDPVENKTKQWEEGKGSLITGNWYKHKNNELWIRILTGYVCNNLTFKPQLYDLTEMFGAGHEPATVAEFRQRFPNELYPYSPQCWLTSYKSAVVCKTKNLFDVNKITESTNLKNNKDGTITVSDYGVSGGLLKNLCPELKVGDVIKVYFQPLKWTAPKPPLVTSAGGVIFDRNGNATLTVTEESLNRPVYFYNNDYSERGLPGVTIIGNILITTDLTITNKNYNVRYTPYQHL